jgi:hypothetical protein
VVVVISELCQDRQEGALIDNDDVVEYLRAKDPDQAFGDRVPFNNSVGWTKVAATEAVASGPTQPWSRR